MRLNLFISLCFVFAFILANSQDIVGGEARWTHTEENTYELMIDLYTDSEFGLDHSEIQFNAGDGSGLETLMGTSVDLPNGMTRWTYSAEHVFPGPGGYQSMASDSFRVAGIENIENSGETYLRILNEVKVTPIGGPNNAVVLENAPFDFNEEDGVIYHDPMPIDPDGDSLYFSLVEPSAVGAALPPGASIDSETGLFQMPAMPGKYAVRIMVEEFRVNLTTTHVGTTFREFLIDGSTISGIDIQSSQHFQAFPNPVIEEVILQSELPMQNVAVYDNRGLLVFARQLRGELRSSISLKGFSGGLYTVVITDIYKKRSSLRLLKQ